MVDFKETGEKPLSDKVIDIDYDTAFETGSGRCDRYVNVRHPHSSEKRDQNVSGSQEMEIKPETKRTEYTTLRNPTINRGMLRVSIPGVNR